MTINQVILVGNVGRDPDVRVLENGEKVVTTTLHTQRQIPFKGGVVVNTDVHQLRTEDCAETALNLRKGDRIAVTGRIEYNLVQVDSITYTRTEIVVDKLVVFP